MQYFGPVQYVARLRAGKTDKNLLLPAVNISASHSGPSRRFSALAEIAREDVVLLD